MIAVDIRVDRNQGRNDENYHEGVTANCRELSEVTGTSLIIVGKMSCPFDDS